MVVENTTEKMKLAAKETIKGLKNQIFVQKIKFLASNFMVFASSILQLW